MTEPVYFKRADVERLWSHGVTVSIAKDTGVYLICWDEEKNPTGPLDMACGYLGDGFYLDENVTPRQDSAKHAEIWEASRYAVGGDDFCDELDDPLVTMRPQDLFLGIEVTEDEIRMQWTSLSLPGVK
jgi:hypothetical protein